MMLISTNVIAWELGYPTKLKKDRKWNVSEDYNDTTVREHLWMIGNLG